MPEEKPLKLIEKLDFLISDGCQPVSVRLLKVICLGLVKVLNGEKPIEIYYCSNCKILHEHQRCPSCDNNTLGGAIPRIEEVKIQEWPKY